MLFTNTIKDSKEIKLWIKQKSKTKPQKSVYVKDYFS